MTMALPASTMPGNAAFAMALTGPRSDAAPPPLGWQRTLLVVADDAELAVALRDRLDRAFLTVYEARPEEAAAALRACRPWPWMVVGQTARIAEPARAALAAHPILALWRGPPPPGLPPHAAVVRSFSELVAAIQGALRSRVEGIQLAVGSGLTMPDGAHEASPALEALVASHPRPMCLTPRQLRAATAALVAHHVALQPTRGLGGVVLVPTEHG